MSEFSVDLKDLGHYATFSVLTSSFKGVGWTDTRFPDRIKMDKLGILGEAGEICDLLKKARFHGHTLDQEKLGNEIGDLLWYMADTVDAGKESGCQLFSLSEPLTDRRHLDLTVPSSLKIRDFTFLDDDTVVDLATCSLADLDSWVNWLHLACDMLVKLLPDLALWHVFRTERPETSFVILRRLAFKAGFDLKRLAEKNLQKLAKRYPEGFSAERSLNRTDS